LNNEQWFMSLVEDCSDIAVEMGFASRWALIEGYHLLGTRILQDELNLTRGGTTLRGTLQDLAKEIGKRERSLYYAVQFVKKFPDLNALPEGKDCNWYHIINKYLTTEIKPKRLTNADLVYKIKELLKIEYQKAKQNEINGTLPEYSKLSDFILYLQDQVEKIGGL